MMLKVLVCLALVAIAEADVSSLPYAYDRPGIQLSSKPSPQIFPAPRRPQQGPFQASQSFPAPSFQAQQIPLPSYSRPDFSAPAPSRNYLGPAPTYSVPPPPPVAYSAVSSFNSQAVSYPGPPQRPVPSYSAPAASYPIPVPSYAAPIINRPPTSSYGAPSNSYSAPAQSLSLPSYNSAPFRPTKSSRDQSIYDYTDDILDNETKNSIQEILAKEERRAVQLDNNIVSIFMENPIRAVDIAQFSVPQINQYSNGFAPSRPVPAPVYGPPRY